MQLDRAPTNYSLRRLLGALMLFSVVTIGVASLQDWDEKQRLSYISLFGTWAGVALGNFYLMLLMRRRKQRKYGTLYLCLGAFATSKSWQRAALFLALFVLLASTIVCVIYVNSAEELPLSPHWTIVTFAFASVSLAALLQSLTLVWIVAAPGVVELFQKTIVVQGCAIGYANVQGAKWADSQAHVLVLSVTRRGHPTKFSSHVPSSQVQAVDRLFSELLGERHSPMKS